jgi:hypothetical protein
MKIVKNPLKFDYTVNDITVKPTHPMISNWAFTEDTADEAALAHYMAVVGEKNGIGVNDLQHIFPAVLRMLKNTSAWSK